MVIDPIHEDVVSLTEAARLLPSRRRGKKPHVSCLYRWTTVGCRGVILESIQVGGTRCTSKAALARFFRRLTKSSVPQRGATCSASPEAVALTKQATEAALDAAGI